MVEDNPDSKKRTGMQHRNIALKKLVSFKSLYPDSKNAWACNVALFKSCILKNLDPHVLGFPLGTLTAPEHEKGKRNFIKLNQI